MVPLPQEMPHFIPSQVAVPSVTTGQAVQEVVPQLLRLLLETHAVPHKWKPELHVMPQVVPLSQVARPLAGIGQAVQEVVPQLLGLEFETQAVPHKWKPELHVNPQVVPLQVAVALAGGVHGVQKVPQVATLVLDAQVVPHR